MSSQGEPISDNHTNAADDHTYDDMPALTPVPASGIPLTTSRRRRRANNPQVQDGSDSDASMPSLQTVSDSSDDEAYGQSTSEWETESEDDSEEDEEEEYPDPDTAWYEPIPPPAQPPAYEGFIEEIRRRRNTDRSAPPTPPLAGGGRPADVPRVPDSQNTFQTQMRSMVESFAAIASATNGPLLPEDFAVFQDIGNLNLAQLLNPFTEVEDDPNRARIIMEKLEVVPNELVGRYEKLRSGIREGMEDVDGCAICREAFLEEGQVVVMACRAIAGTTTSSDALPGKQPSEQTPPSHQASISSQSPAPAESSQQFPKILVFPCPGMHLFHADCLAPWLSRKTTCPSCRYDVDPHSLTLRQDRFTAQIDESHALRSFRSPPFPIPPAEPFRGQAPTENRPPSPRIPGWFEETLSVNPDLGEEQPTGRRDVEVDATHAPPSNNDIIRLERPTRRHWRPPKGRDFRRWLDRQEKKKDGIEVEDDSDADDSELDDDGLLFDDSPLRFARAPQIVQDAVRQFVGDIGVQLGLPPVPPPAVPPPAPAAIPAIPPWEEGEFPGSNASAFVGARRAAAVSGIPRPSPLRFEAIAHPVDSDYDNPYYDEDEDEDEDDDDDASSMPELGVPEQVEFQQLMRALRGRESTIPSTSSEFGSSRGVDVSEDEDEDDDDDLPPLIPDTIGRPLAAAAPAASSTSNNARIANRDPPTPIARQRFADRLPRLFQGYFQPQSGSLGLHTGPNTSQPSRVSEGSANPRPEPRRSSLDDVDD